MSQIVSAAAGVCVHLRELAVVVGDLTSSLAARSGDGNSRGWWRVDTMMIWFCARCVFFLLCVRVYDSMGNLGKWRNVAFLILTAYDVGLVVCGVAALRFAS